MRRIELPDLRAIFPHASARRLEPFVEPLNECFGEFEINTAKRQAAFIAQVGHESGSFAFLSELASGDAYEGRADLGNVEAGDGRRFKGRGLMQITGRKNYGTVGEALGLDLLAEPWLLGVPRNAVRSAGWFWINGAGLNLSKRAIRYGVPVGCNLNDIADAGDFKGITLAINGGLVGMDERLKYHAKALEVLVS
jgi:putative chitinase